jgi:glycosyltransferase involved in cell wall biosynthesis
MRVAHVITRLIIGGAQENTLWTVDDQHHLYGDEVCLITGPGRGPEGSLEPVARERGLDLKLVPQFYRNISPRHELAALKTVQRHLADFAPQIVHTHSSKAGIVGRLAAHRLGIPAVHTIHGAAFHVGQSRAAFRLYRFLERRAAAWCDHFITVCDAMQRQYLDAGIAEPERYTTIYSGMDVDRIQAPSRAPSVIRQSLGIDSNALVVGKIARLFPLKGHKFLIEAARAVVDKVPQVQFLLLGDGILREQFEARVAELGLQDHFKFAGLIPPTEVADYIHAMDIVAHTSEWEGLARVLPQGLIVGKPVVSFDIDGAREVCIPDTTGYLIPAGDIDALATAITQLATDAPLRHRMGEEGRRRFQDVFRHQTMTEQIRAVYQQVLDRRGER